MLVERHLPADFRWKGNRRKRAPRAPKVPLPRGAEGRSLDSFKLLATSEKKSTEPVTYGDRLAGFKDARLRQARKGHLHWQLMQTIKGLARWEEIKNNWDIADQAIGAVPLKKKRKSREWSALKDLERLSGCQSEWIGFKPACCDGRAVAVPIGCNHRLCPLCNDHRAERYRSRVQTLFGNLSNAQLLTLTVPSPKKISREVIDTLRARLRAFLKQQPLLKGGVYSIEITYNSTQKTWHPHVHILVDVADPRTRIPRTEFLERKWHLEFDWFILTQGKKAGARRWKPSDWREWARVSTRPDGTDRVEGPTAGIHRRTIDLRPVDKSRKAAYEVLKYMSKAASFIGDPEALQQILVAIRGVRQIQTFGSCYGFQFDTKEPVESHLKCDCGANVFKPIGILGLGMVKLSKEGTWYVRDDAPVHGRQRCRGSS